MKSTICPDDPFPDSPPIKRTKEEAKKEEAEKGKTAERDEPTEKRFPRVQVLYPYEAEEEGELSINAGDIITVLESTPNKGFAFFFFFLPPRSFLFLLSLVSRACN